MNANLITPSKIQLIVDGECSSESQTAMLREFDAEPAAWRTLALALLEEREWAHDIPAAAQARSQSTPSVPAQETSVQRVVMSDSSQRKGLGLSNWLPVLAASLLLGLGFYGGTFLSPSTPVTNVGTAPAPTIATSQGTMPDLAAMKIYVPLSDSETQEIPIYGQNEYGLVVARENYEIARANEELRKKGFELDVQPKYYTGKLSDGRQLIVPVKNVGLKPFGL
jgi:hypothetical protein